MTAERTDLVVIGAGPAGLFSVFQAGQLGLRCHVVDVLEKPGGQCAELYPEKPIYDIPGIPSCSGASLVQGLLAQIDRFAPTFHLGQRAEQLHRSDGSWHLKTSAGTSLEAGAIVVAAGAGCFTPRPLTAEGAKAFEDTSLLYSIRDVERFAGKRLLILGGGDSALDWAVALEPIASRVTLVHRRDVFRAAPDSVEHMRRLADEKRMDLRFGVVTALHGDPPQVSSASLALSDGSTARVTCDYVLAFFGLTNKLGPLSEWGLGVSDDRITVDSVTMQTRVPGVFAVGDVADYPGKLKLILTGFNEAALMSHAAYQYLRGEKPHFGYSTHSSMLAGGAKVIWESPKTPAALAAERISVLEEGLAKSEIRVLDLAGIEHAINAKPGSTILEVLNDAKIPIKGSCYGCCNCSTCHVYVDPAWFDRLDPMIEQEQEALDQVSVPSSTSRLACQIVFQEALSGLRIRLTEDTIPD